MPTDTPSTSEASFNVDLRGAHYDFLKERVPDWFMQGSTQRQEELGKLEMEMPAWYQAASPQSKADLAQAHGRFRETLNQVEGRLGQIQDVLDFGEQPLKDAIKARFNLELDVRHVYFARKYGSKGRRDDFYGAFVFDTQNDPSLTYEYRGMSLLEAALANFEAAEEQPSPCADCQIITTWNNDNAEILSTYAAVKAQAVAIEPHAFATLCRTLDLGTLYQNHLKAVLQPEGAGEREALEQQLQAYHQQQFALCVEIAWLGPQGRIRADVYAMLKQLALGQGAGLTLDGRPVTFSAMNLFDSMLVGPLLIGPDRQNSDRTERLVVYIPNDPQQPIKEYASSADFMVDIRTRLQSASYRRFFSRFVPQRDQGGFFNQFNKLYRPANGATNEGDYPLQPQPKRLPIREMAITGNLWEQSIHAHTRKIFADARAVAVPTEDEDRKARLERLESYFDAAVSVFNLAAFVVPGLGPIMLAVGASQMCDEVFEGIEAYGRGELKEMWGHFASVALNVAFIATGAKVLPEIKWQSALDNFKPVTMPTGKQVLWRADLGGYEAPITLASGAKANALGLYAHDGKEIVAIEGKHYRVKQEADTGQYRIQHPTRPDAYAPELEHNHNGVWTHELEDPQSWDEPTLHRRLGITEHAEPLRISGVESAALRQVAVEHAPLPLLFDDTLKRFELHQQLSTFVEQINSNDPLVHRQAEPALQFEMLQRRGLLPEDTPLKIIGPDGAVLWETPNSSASLSKRVVVLTQSAWAQGHLLREVLYTLQGVDPQLKEFPGRPEESLEVRAGKLRQYIGEAVDSLKGPLLEERYRAQTATRDADVQHLVDTFAPLPSAAAEQLLKDATLDERQAFRRTAVLPEHLLVRAKWCAQETRVARAYEGLQLDAQTHLDSHRLALRTLETLPGWHRGSRVELRRYSLQGTVLDAIGSPDFPSRRTLVVLENGQLQGAPSGDLYTAMWELLAHAERQRMGVNSALALKQAIQRSPLPREALRTALEENPIRKPDYDPMVRLMGGAPGYRQVLKSARNALRSPTERVEKLFPSFSPEQVTAFIQSLGEDVRGALARRELEYQNLKKTLKVWQRSERAPGDSRSRFADYMLRCWRRETGTTLTIVAEEGLPPIRGDFSHVRGLNCYAPNWSGDIQTFLENFTQLHKLELLSHLTELPPPIADMKNLTWLSLPANGLRLNPRTAGVLSELRALEHLNLSKNPLGVLPDFSGLSQLRTLNLSESKINQWPTGLRTQRQLESVDLSFNQLQQVPQENLTPPPEHLEAITRINLVTRLKGNPFPADYWKVFDAYWKNLAQTRPDLIRGHLYDVFDSGNPLLQAFMEIYPNRNDQALRELIWDLGDGAEAEVARLKVEFDRFQQQLDAWMLTGGGEHQPYLHVGRRASDATALHARQVARRRMLQCWRRETSPVLGDDGTPLGWELNLSGLYLPSLPDLDTDFSHVGSLKLSDLHLSSSPQGFLARFPGARELDLSHNLLFEIPAAARQMPGLTRLDLQGNRIRILPDSLLTPTDAQLAQTASFTRVINMAGNPLSAQTRRRVMAYGNRLREIGLATAEQPDLLVSSALSRGVQALAPIDTAPLQRWLSALSPEQVAQRTEQWTTLRWDAGSDGFFEVLRDLQHMDAGHADLQRRVWEVIDSITENSVESEQLRKDMFEWAGRAACCDRAALSFGHLEVLALVYKAKKLALDATQGRALVTLCRGLFRLDEVEKIALKEIDRRRTAINEREDLTPDQKELALEGVEEVEIRLAYRDGLKDRLELPGQPHETHYTHLVDITEAMLDDAYRQVTRLDNSPQALQAMLAREFWKDFITHKYRSRFDTQNEPHQAQMARLQNDFDTGTLSEAAFGVKAAELHAQFAIEEAQLIQTLSREEVAQALVPEDALQVLVESADSAAPGLSLTQAQAIDFKGKQYFVASMPDAGDGEHYVLWVQAQDNPLALVSSGIIARPDRAGGWKRRGLAAGMQAQGPDEAFEDALESMPVAPYTATELSMMRESVHFTRRPNRPGSYHRANNGKYPLRDYQGRPIRIRKMMRSVTLDNGTQYTSAPLKPYIQFEGYEAVAARYEEKLSVRVFTAEDMKAPQEQALIGQSMVVANRRIAKGEIVGVYGGTVLPEGLFGPSGQTYTLSIGKRPVMSGGKIVGSEAIHLSGDNITSRINTLLEYDAEGKPLRQAAAGYNAELVGFPVEADMLLGMGPEVKTTRKDFVLSAVFATDDIPAGAELRMDYGYTDSVVQRLFS
ncbi:NEL-type E3 ubiquitin ligase domain-containing protein [Pseudomonas sp. L1(2025)]|uniref:NEL-type E3 ubiquitin ligase domain-containing protein n=1 Tax=Pseudomonas sp. L1(2025) TaxID=3449429 RepID=UPI003F691663